MAFWYSSPRQIRPLREWTISSKPPPFSPLNQHVFATRPLRNHPTPTTSRPLLPTLSSAIPKPRSYDQSPSHQHAQHRTIRPPRRFAVHRFAVSRAAARHDAAARRGLARRSRTGLTLGSPPWPPSPHPQTLLRARFLSDRLAEYRYRGPYAVLLVSADRMLRLRSGYALN